MLSAQRDYKSAGPAYAPSALKELYPGGTYVDMHRGLVWGVVTREDHMLVAKYFSSERMQDAVAVQCKIAAVGLAPAVVSCLSELSLLFPLLC